MSSVEVLTLLLAVVALVVGLLAYFRRPRP